MAGHSPLPWTAKRSTVGDNAINEIVDAQGHEVNARGFGLSGSPRAAANSDLMFLAVNSHFDMLEALQAVVRVADRQTVEFDVARAAIAKAEGRS